jgi:hypothetical protein
MSHHSSTRIMRCAACQSDDVVRDAWASWSYQSQQWELSQVFDHAFCEQCESDCSIEEAPG